MRWLCFLLLANPYPLAAQASPKPLRFDLEGLTAKRDSFVFFLRGAERGYAVWQYEIRPLEMTQRILYTARSEFRPVEQESLRVVLNRLTGEPIATFHHIDLFSPTSDTIMVEHDLEDTGTAWSGETVSMRWVLVHMIEETARHAGHMDIVRELIDGAAGDHRPA